MLVGPLKASKQPIRMKEGATRVSTQPVSSRSRITGRAGSDMRDKARVVGMLRACIASEQRYSRMDDRRTARPSADREKGVRPEPLSCNSYVRSGSLGWGVTSGEELVNKFEGVLGVLTNRNGT